MRLHHVLLALFVSPLVFTGCGLNPLPAGAVCEGTADCDDGLSCIDLAVHSKPSECEVVGQMCSVHCRTDKDCEGLGKEGETFKCLEGCGDAASCGLVEYKEEDLPAGAVCKGSGQCGEGLSCIDFSVHPTPDTCEVAGQSCSISCDADKDCEGLGDEGSTFKCFKNCDETSSCGAIQ